MIMFVTIMSWLVVGFTLDLLGVFDSNESDTDSSENGTEATPHETWSSPLNAALLGSEYAADTSEPLLDSDGIERLAETPSGEGEMEDDWMTDTRTTHTDEAEVGLQILRQEVGDDALARLSESNLAEAETSQEALDQQQLDLLQESEMARSGAPASIAGFDEEEDAIVFAYDPAITPDPKLEMRDAEIPGSKVLMMNGQVMVQFDQCNNLALADINIIETPIIA